MIENHEVYAIYIFRNTPSTVYDQKGIECIATINNCPHNETFYNGFCSTLRRIKRKYKKHLVWIENTSDSNTIIKYNVRYNVIQKTSCPTGFFFTTMQVIVIEIIIVYLFINVHICRL